MELHPTSKPAPAPLPDVDERGKRRMLDLLSEFSGSGASIFDSKEAAAYSCYAGILKPKESDEPGMEKLLRVVPEGQLWPDANDAIIPPLGEAAHNMLRAYILGEHYPCVGARAAFSKGTYRFGFYKELAHLSSVAAMGHNLRRFVSEYEKLGDFTTFIAVFKYPQSTGEDRFEDLLWKHLQSLSDHDTVGWDPHYDPDPQSNHFAFSFAGEAFFVVGMHPGSSRFSRRVAFPTLVFNPESQIRRLLEEDGLERFTNVIRQRDTLYQGGPNPSLPSASGTTGGEARVYSGKAHRDGDGWNCPFHKGQAL